MKILRLTSIKGSYDKGLNTHCTAVIQLSGDGRGAYVDRISGNAQL